MINDTIYMAHLHISDLEAAINFWRGKGLPAVAQDLGPELNALSKVYGQLVYEKGQWLDEASLANTAYQAWLAWYSTTADTPCIAICSTSQGDAVCKGCGRCFEEVQRWPEMTPIQKRLVWRRITLEGNALRFNRYAERIRK